MTHNNSEADWNLWYVEGDDWEKTWNRKIL